MKPLPAPNIQANPHPQNNTPQRQVSMTPSNSTLTVSRLLAKPASNIIKPACIKNTRNAVIKTHIVLIGFKYSGVAAAAGAGAAAGAAAAAAAAGATASSAQTFAEI